jgi:hypothetical protein
VVCIWSWSCEDTTQLGPIQKQGFSAAYYKYGDPHNVTNTRNFIL